MLHALEVLVYLSEHTYLQKEADSGYEPAANAAEMATVCCTKWSLEYVLKDRPI